MKTRKVFLILTAFAAAATAYADKVQFSQLPAPVQQAIRSRSGRTTIEDIDRDVKNGQTTYEASWKNQAGAQQELLLSDTGAILRDVPSGKKKGNRPVTMPTATSSVIPPATSTSTTTAATNPALTNFTAGQKAPLNWASETVQNKLKSISNGANIANFQKGRFEGQTAYRANYKSNGQMVTVIMADDGRILASNPPNLAINPVPLTTTPSAVALQNAQQAPINWASETVQNKFKQFANGANIENFQKGQFNGRTAYEGTYLQNGQRMSVVIGEDGTVLSNPVGAPGTSVTGSSSGK